MKSLFYGFSVKDLPEADCVAELVKMYQQLVKEPAHLSLCFTPNTNRDHS